MKDFERDPFKAAWCFVRYDDFQIFEADEDYWENKCAELENAGYTHLMTFSNTHFRWSHYLEWARLNEVLRRLVEAAHRHHLYVVEHHSANLLWEASAVFDPARRVDSRSFSEKWWAALPRDVNVDNSFKGVKLKSMLQVDGRIGDPHVTFYNSYIMCHNNPDYLRLYKEYLASVYATGVDGIMTDDVQFLAEGFAACACPHCRAAFKAKYGEALPPNGKAWEEFIADESAPLFLKWKEFRYNSIVNFHREIKNHYEGLGLKMLRPNFAATCVAWRSPWGGVFDELPALDWAFIEHCCGVIRYSWPEYLVESVHCNMMAEERRIPAMSLYYPSAPDAQKFAWALSLYVGHRYFGDPREGEMFRQMSKFHQFENEHFSTLFRSTPLRRVAILDCVKSRELDWLYNTSTRDVLCSLGQSMTRFNLPWAMVNTLDPAAYRKFDVIVAPARILTDGEISDLANYAASGGILVWVDGAGSIDASTMAARPAAELERLLAGAKVVKAAPERLSTRFIKRCRVNDPADRDPFDCAEPTRWQPLTPEELARSKANVEFVAGLLPEGRGLEISPSPADLLASAWYSEERREMSVRFCNASGTMENPAEPGFGERDPIPFPAFAGKCVVKLAKPTALKSHRFSRAELATDAGTFPAEVADFGEYLEATWDFENLKDFALLTIN